MEEDNSNNSGIVKLVLVVGFHHKKGAQIEYVYPETYSIPEISQKYKNLPHLALPDGAHNFNEETTYLLFPKGEYAVSHYRQIAKSDLIQDKLDEDVTRNTVQKAVVVICQNPNNVNVNISDSSNTNSSPSSYLLGPVAKKLAIISKAYFEERDFSQTEVLKDLYDQFQQNARLLTKESIYRKMQKKIETIEK